MAKTKVELNRSGVRELMKSAEMQAILLERQIKYHQMQRKSRMWRKRERL